MRTAIAAVTLPLLMLAACKVTKDDQNDTITAEYNQDIAENGLADAANEAENIAEDVANDVSEAADKAENTAEDLQDSNAAN